MHFDIVIVGGGAGGLELAAMLGRRLGRRQGRERVLLIDRSAFHIWKPTLHEVAAGTLDAHQEGLSYTILARRNHFSFTLGELDGLEAGTRRLTLKALQDEQGQTLIPARQVSFRWAVLAIGSGSNFFGTPGAEHAFVLEQAHDAERFRQRLLAAFTRAAFSPEKRLGVAIVGAGATGVELSAELIEAHQELQDGLGSEQRFRLDISVVEAGPRILGGLPEKISRQATVALQRKQVRVMTGTKVQAIEADGLQTSQGRVPADLIVWAAGIKAADSNLRYGLSTNRAHQFIVNDRLETSAPGLYALGDCAACVWEGDKLVPARAQAAHQQACYLLQVFLALLAERVHAPAFRYRDFGSLVSLGDNKGVGNLMGGLSGRNFFVEGLLAKWMYMSLHLNHHRAIVGGVNTVVLALARLLQRRVSGRLKLH
ncbi:NAD(P)/FAD-dependent oxidoreductase [Ideonella livida]|uniref:FAD-dependent oxidoreductase n=1 Tax=Ideonella livida TaxID=2707176 RepID=A0A7C9TJ81_9BURK|nr:FAD-dependent oxidoreductase [Ideonella livida]NDY90047.1 FAD-dependent oxidoreductase [Ideonella livida]